MSLADAVITVSSDFDENPTQGIQSVLRNHTHFNTLHIVKRNQNIDVTELAQLEEKGLGPVWHNNGALDLSLVTKGRALIHVSPDHYIEDGGVLTRLYEAMDATSDWQCEYGVTSTLDLEDQQNDWRVSRHWINAAAYGFLVVLLWFDSHRSFFNGTKYHRTVDLRAQTLSIRYPNRVNADRPRWWLWLFFTRVYGIIRSESVVQMPPTEDCGWPFVLRTFKQHRHMGWSFLFRPVRMIQFFVLYVAFAWPWWNGYINILSGSILHLILNVNVWGTTWLLMYCVNCAFVLSISYNGTIRLPLGTLAPIALLFPFYLALTPLVFLISLLPISYATKPGAVDSKKRIEKRAVFKEDVATAIVEDDDDVDDDE